MYEYIKGTIVELSPTEVVIEAGGIGYKLLISLQSYGKLQGTESAKVYVYHYIREDDEALFGFFDKEERRIFTLLITVSGIGPNTARMMLSSLSSDEVCTAVISGDVNKIKSVKGIGLKTAQKAIIELKDKIAKGSTASGETNFGFIENKIQTEACSALITLGFNKGVVEKLVSTILNKEPSCSVEDLIKKALKQL